MPKKSKAVIAGQVLSWYDHNKQSMPWRDDPDIYHIWLSEIMLQQTQIKTVIPYYYNWLKLFPTIQDVAMANEQDILKAWEGLGYYSRAMNFFNACKIIVKDYKGIIPSNEEDFIKLKGVGPYIDAAVRSIAYNHIVPTIDGNVNRVMSRVLCIDKPVIKEQKFIYDFLMSNIDKERPGDFNQALMDLGRNICKPKKPICHECPISDNCEAYLLDTVEEYPIKNKPKTIPHYNVAVGVVWKKDDILIAKRKLGGLLGGLWEFPGGKLENNESAEDCVIREIYEEIGVNIEIKSFISTIKHQYSHFSISLDSFHCLYIDGEPKPKTSSELKWISPKDIPNFPFPKANHKFINKIPDYNPCT